MRTVPTWLAAMRRRWSHPPGRHAAPPVPPPRPPVDMPGWFRSPAAIGVTAAMDTLTDFRVPMHRPYAAPGVVPRGSHHRSLP